MHMADALVSPSVGAAAWAAAGAGIVFCARRVKESPDDRRVPLMGVLGAFIFAAQMVTFAIPGTGSSGHLGGGLILAILLGPHAAFLVMASVLTVQAFFFADGGLLALGCNILNLGFFPAFVAYPLIYRPIARGQFGTTRAWTAALVAAVVGLQFGAVSVVLQTTLSGIAALPFAGFLALMLPIHLVIGIVEGAATAVVVAFVANARPEIVPTAPAPAQSVSLRPVLAGILVAAALIGGVVSWFASTRPDGLEWAVAGAAGQEEVVVPEQGIHQALATVQEGTAVLPDYALPESSADRDPSPGGAVWPAVSAGTTVSGLIGGLLTLGLACLFGFALKRFSTANAHGR